MIVASTYLPSANSSTIVASSIHGTGAQNFSNAMRKGCMLMSGIALGPDFINRRRASPLVKPPETSFRASVELADTLAATARVVCVSTGLGSFAADHGVEAGSWSRAELGVIFAFVSDAGFEFEAARGSALAFITGGPFRHAPERQRDAAERRALSYRRRWRGPECGRKVSVRRRHPATGIRVKAAPPRRAQKLLTPPIL